MNRIFRDIFRSFPRAILVTEVFLFIITESVIHLRFIGYILLTEIITRVLKNIFKKSDLPHDIVLRPKNAGRGMGCGTIPETVNVDHQSGLPSGHATLATMTATFWILYITKQESSLISKMLRSLLLILLAIGVVLSRTDLGENCHTPLQSMTGGLLGILLGVVFWRVENYNNLD